MTRYVWQNESDDDWYIERYTRLTEDAESGAVVAQTALEQRRRYRLIETLNAPPEGVDKLSGSRWHRLDDLVQTLGMNRLEIEAMLLEWLLAGWIETEEYFDRFQQQWRVERLRLSPIAYDHLVLGPRRARQSIRSRQQRAILQKLDGWQAEAEHAQQLFRDEPDTCLLIEQIANILHAQEVALEQSEWQPLPQTAQQLGGPVHQRWLLCLRGLLNLMAYPRLEYERVFSAVWLGDSKAFSPDRRDLEDYLQVEDGLTRFGLVRHTPVVYCYGNWRAIIDGRVLDGRAGLPFVALTAETIIKMQDVSVCTNEVLVVENQSAFEALLLSNRYREDTLYLYSGGFPGYAEKLLLAQWVAAHPELRLTIWTDWDLGGVRIQQHWEQWATQQGLSKPAMFGWQLMDKQLAVSMGKALTPTEKARLRQLDHPLATRLLSWNVKLEQEAWLGRVSSE